MSINTNHTTDQFTATTGAMTIVNTGTLTLPTVTGSIPIAPTVTTFTGSGTFAKKATGTNSLVGGVGGAGGAGVVIVVEW